MNHGGWRRPVLSTNTGISSRTADVSAIFIARTRRDPGHNKPELRSNYSMSWRLYFLLAGLMIVFALSHVLALQKIEAMQSKRLVTAIDPLAD